jgi:hypothetical protein
VRLDPKALTAMEAESLATSLGVTVGEKHTVLVCGATARDCRLVNADALIIVAHAPSISGDTASVVLTSILPTGNARSPLVVEDRRYELTRTGMKWHVTAVKRLRIT